MNSTSRIMQQALLALLAVLHAGLFAATAQAEDVVVYVHTDPLGSPIAYTNEQGVVIEREYYTPYGEALNANNALGADSAGYTGHVKDADTGLIYAQQRYYDPVVGRFLSTDPVTFSPDKPDHFNRYWYANGNPYGYTDPNGKAAFTAFRATFAIAAADAATPDPSDAAAPAKAAAYGGALIGTAIGGGIYWGIDKVFNESGDGQSDPLDKVLDGATPGDETKGRTTNWEKGGGESQKEADFDALVPDGGRESETSQGDKVRVGDTEDGRTVISRPSTKDGRPTLEVQDGKNKTKIRYDD